MSNARQNIWRYKFSPSKKTLGEVPSNGPKHRIQIFKLGLAGELRDR